MLPFSDDYELIEYRFNMNINVFTYENKVYPIYLSKKFHKHVLNLLSITKDNKSHYVFIKNFNKLMYSIQNINIENFIVCNV